MLRLKELKCGIHLTTSIVGSTKRNAYIQIEKKTIKTFRLLQNLSQAVGFVKLRDRLKAIHPNDIQSAKAFMWMKVEDIPHKL